MWQQHDSEFVERTYLANSQVAKATNELLLVKSIRCLLHTTHGGHLRVHLEEALLGDLNLKRRLFAVVRVEGLLVQLNLERVGRRWLLQRLCAVRRGLKRARERAGRLYIIRLHVRRLKSKKKKPKRKGQLTKRRGATVRRRAREAMEEDLPRRTGRRKGGG
jgi:hypothetical protein